jgi:fucose permease
MGVISLSTLFFALLGIDNWSKLALLWAVIPALNAVYFCFVPICDILSEGQEGMTLRELFKSRLFWLLAFLMFCTGAAELSVSQWASAFAESGLGISKTAGDLAGPCLFAALMGVARVLYSKLAGRIQTEKYMSVSAVIFLLGYSLTAFSPVPALSLAGCGICGFAVGVLWPGTITVAAARCKRGGTAMFAMLALTGDLGCAAGPTLVGFVSGKFGGALSSGLMGAIIFPVLLVLGLFTLRFKDVKN